MIEETKDVLEFYIDLEEKGQSSVFSFLFFSFSEIRFFFYVSQAGFEIYNSSDPPGSASLLARTMRISPGPWLKRKVSHLGPT